MLMDFILPPHVHVAAMKIRSQQAADALLDRAVHFLFVSKGLARKDAAQLVRFELGYYAGYMSFETRVIVEKLFDAPHPFIGSALDVGQLSPRSLMCLGFDIAEAICALKEEAEQWEHAHADVK